MRGRGLSIDAPVSWLTAGWWDALGLAGRGAYVSGLMWSMSQRLDGFLPRSALRFIDADTEMVAEALGCAVSLGRMRENPDGWEYIDWEWMQMQSTAEQIDAYRERKRRNQATSRSSRKVTVTGDTTGDTAGDTAGDRAGDVGKEREGQGMMQKEAEVQTFWATRNPGTKEWFPAGAAG